LPLAFSFETKVAVTFGMVKYSLASEINT
jgi:hypothetical protein